VKPQMKKSAFHQRSLVIVSSSCETELVLPLNITPEFVEAVQVGLALAGKYVNKTFTAVV